MINENEYDDLANNKKNFEDKLKKAAGLPKLKDLEKQSQFEEIIETFSKILDGEIKKIFDIKDAADIEKVNKGLIASSNILNSLINIHLGKIEKEKDGENPSMDNGEFIPESKKN